MIFKVVRVHNFNKKVSKENLKNPKPQDDFNKPRVFKIPSEEAIQQARRVQPDANDDDLLLRRIVEVGNIDMLQNRVLTHRDIARHWDPQKPYYISTQSNQYRRPSYPRRSTECV